MWKKYSSPVYQAEGDPPSAPPPQPPSPPAPVPTPAPTPPAVEEGETKKPWYLERIDQLTAKNYELTAQVKAATPPPAATALTKTYTEAELQTLAAQKATELVDANDFNKQCNAAYEKGTAAHPDFQQKLGMLNTVSGGLMSRALVDAALETGVAEDVLYELGSKPELAQEIVGLSPAKMAVRIAKLAGELGKAPPVKPASGAPPPIIPKLKGDSTVEPKLDDPNVPTADWMEMRNKQLKEKKRA